jgi:hypothetical protein
MQDQYYIDFQAFSLDRFKNNLKSGDVLPGRLILPEDIEKLAAVGITHSKHFVECGNTRKKREELSELTGISMPALLEMAKLSDLARVRGLGPAFTRLFFESGAETLQQLSVCDPKVLFREVHAMNQEKLVTKTIPPLKDFYQYVEQAKDLPKIVEFE